MTRIIEAHGCTFALEGDGFVKNHASSDFEAGCEAIETTLLKMDAERVRALHAASRAWVQADCDGERPDDMTRIERIGEKIATAGWYHPETATISMSAVA